MNLRSLLVLLDGDERCDARIHLAARFAVAHDSHLVGTAPTGLMELPSGLGAASRFMDDADAARAEALRRASGWVEHFRARCRAEGVASVEAGVHEGEKASAVLHHAHCADLTVIGQADPASASHREDKRFVEQVLLHNARPTLIVPHAGRFDAVGDSAPTSAKSPTPKRASRKWPRNFSYGVRFSGARPKCLSGHRDLAVCDSAQTRHHTTRTLLTGMARRLPANLSVRPSLRLTRINSSLRCPHSMNCP